MSYIVEREVIESVRIERKSMNKLEDWKGVEFESSTGKTPEFMAFASMYRAWVKKTAAAHGAEVLNWSNGHFECSAFIKNIQTGKLMYFHASDVRYFPTSWHEDILVRTAKHDKDWTGGQNQSASLETLGTRIDQLTA